MKSVDLKVIGSGIKASDRLVNEENRINETYVAKTSSNKNGQDLLCQFHSNLEKVTKLQQQLSFMLGEVKSLIR